MFDALTHSDLAAIHDLAVKRARLDLAGAAARESDRTAATAWLFEKIAKLEPHALAELLALVRLGRDGRGARWLVLLHEARAQAVDGSAGHLATTPALDELIERGLLTLRDQSIEGSSVT